MREKMSKELYYDDEACCYRDIPKFEYPKEDELLKIFPEFKEFIPIKLQEARLAKKQFIDFVVKPHLKETRAAARESNMWFYKQVLRSLISKRIKVLNGNIRRLGRLNNFINPGNNKSNSTKEQFRAAIERARDVPILEITGPLENLRKGGKNYLAKCPLHEDRSPSFYVYPDTNSFYCFGCQKGGGVIKFVELYYGYDFKKAVEYLNGGR